MIRSLIRVGARCACLLAAALLVASTLAIADDDDDDRDKARELRRQKRILPYRQLRDRVLSRFPGRIIEVELESDDGRLVYEMTVVTRRGRVLEIEIDARSGRFLEIEEDD